jgi:transposase
MSILFVGLDVHKDTIAVAIAEEGRTGEVRAYGTIDNTPDNVDRLLKKLGRSGRELEVCYEAGPCGYGLYRQIVVTGHQCMVVAPSRIPKRAGDRVKTDRRDAVMLAKLHRAGELERVWVPDTAHEAMRDLVGSRTAAVEHLKKVRQQLQSFLLRHGRGYNGLKAWTRPHSLWLANQKFEHPAHQLVFQDHVNAVIDAKERHDQLLKIIDDLVPQWSMKPLVEALCTIKGVSTTVATAVVAATGDLRRFASPRQLMAYFGLVPSEHSSGGRVQRRSITKSGNCEVRRLLIQSAWCYRFPPRITKDSVDKYSATEKPYRHVAWKAQVRLTSRYRRLTAAGKKAPVVVTAIARELTAFIWEMGQIVPLSP